MNRLVPVGVWAALCLITVPAWAQQSDAKLTRLERSYWFHASLAYKPGANYWYPGPSDCSVPTEQQVENGAKLLCGRYAANRLYLMYHREIPVDEAEKVFSLWRKRCPAEVEIVPTLVLRMYDKELSKVFSPDDLRRLCRFFKETLKVARIGVYDVYPNRDQGPELDVLAEAFPGKLVRVGIQPDEPLRPPFTEAVQDTWSGFCHGKSNADWMDKGFGAQTLREWVGIRNRSEHRTAWNLIVVAWDYSNTKRGEYPGYDDAKKNMPLPAGRNVLAARQILHLSDPAKLAGFSSDLFILHTNSAAASHDGPQRSFYDTLRNGEDYRGYYALPFAEVTAIYRGLREGRLLEHAPATHPASAPRPN
ncbi:MAG TPA: hypothetical protein VLM89_14835 [Phycisphaerae bacterium]|nr:hypothetical protein [Phycisphaerae bacterium]